MTVIHILLQLLEHGDLLFWVFELVELWLWLLKHLLLSVLIENHHVFSPLPLEWQAHVQRLLALHACIKLGLEVVAHAARLHWPCRHHPRALLLHQVVVVLDLVHRLNLRLHLPVERLLLVLLLLLHQLLKTQRLVLFAEHELCHFQFHEHGLV